MQTNFSAKQLEQPVVQEANRILRSCVRCGMCTAHCPTYQLLGHEADSPRGRIALIRNMLEQGGAPGAETVLHLDRCLSCFACSSICPSEVDYRHLLDHARSYIEDNYRRPLLDRLLRTMLAGTLHRSTLLSWLLTLGRPFKPVLTRLPDGRLRALAAMIPDRFPTMPVPPAGWHHPEGTPVARVALFVGCVQNVLAPEIYHRAISLLGRFGVSVYLPGESHCCGSMVQHLGRTAEARSAARKTLTLFADHHSLDAIITTVSGCGAALKDYPNLYGASEDFAKKCLDISEFLASLSPPERQGDVDATVAYHAACTLQHGQGIVAQPRQILERASFRVRTPAESHLCCGSAGSYNILQPEIAARLLERKLGHLHGLEADYIAAGNIGCLLHLGRASAVPVVHTLELLDWAYGGQKPEGIHRR